MTERTHLVALLWIAILCVPVIAQPSRGGRDSLPPSTGASIDVEDLVNRLMRFDRNRDGRVGIDEVPERMQALIRRGDTDGDDAVDRAEARVILATSTRSQRDGTANTAGRQRDALLVAIDTDRDRVLSEHEIRQSHVALRELDTNNDGRLTAAELGPLANGQQSGRRSRAQPGDRDRNAAPSGRGQRRGQPRDSGAARQSDGPTRDRGNGTSAVLAILDGNQDGELDRAEIRSAPASLRQRDVNGDGELDRTELQPGGRSERRGRRG